MSSRYLSVQELKGLEKIGDCIIPSIGTLPSFSRSSYQENLDIVFSEMPEKDRKDVKNLFYILSWVPSIFVQIFLWKIDLFAKIPDWLGPLGSIPRLIRFGLKGIIMSLYYSQKEIHRTIGYNARVEGLKETLP